jgi:hypothetical protein
MQWLATHLQQAFPALRIGFDLSDMSGYAYYSGPRFAIYGKGCSDALARGGRYDEVGAIFGRNRPAVGFSLDLKALAEVARTSSAPAAIRAPWGEDPGCAPRCGACAKPARSWWPFCRATAAPRRPLSATANWSAWTGRWVLQALNS